MNYRLDLVGRVFVFIFTLEAILKIMALGLVCGNKAYFKSGWNVIDFSVAVTGLLEFIL